MTTQKIPTDPKALQEYVRELYKRYPIQPDNELKVWERWVTIRQEEIKHLAKGVSKPPVDLAMNRIEKFREDIERKRVLEYAQINVMPVIRGDPWQQPLRLKHTDYSKPVYEIVRYAKDLGKPHVIERVGVPHHIQVTEKGLTGEPQRKPCKTLNAEYFKYREEREKKFEKRIKKLNPFTPDMDGLVIIGSKPKPPPLPPPIVPIINITYNTQSQVDALSGVYSLRVNKTLFLKYIPNQTVPHLQAMQRESWLENCTQWTYYFNVPHGRVGRSKLFLQNLGTITLRYCWKRIKRPIPYIPDEPPEQVFFFNKNEDVLSPGQTKEIIFTFISSKPGIFKEFWELSPCNIYLFDVIGTKIIVNLYADAVENVNNKTMIINIILDKICRKSNYKMIKNLLYKLVDEATVIKPLIYPYKKLFLESELFIMKNPVCYYHQTDVQILKEKFTEMGGTKWDLSISAWRKLMMSKEFEERSESYNFLKTTHSDLLKPTFGTDSLYKEKLRVVKVFLGQLMDSFYDEYMRLSEINGLNEKQLTQLGDEHIYSTTGKSRSKIVMPSVSVIKPLTAFVVDNTFFICMYRHVVDTIELCSGVLSSMELDRWLEFDFCQW